MIELVVVQLRGAPIGNALSARFGPAGGSIGRAATNTLVLDDPDRTVSRVHAQVEWRDGHFVVVDRGSNPMAHNGRPLGNGRAAVLAAGDRLTVGGFELSVRDAGGAAALAGQPSAAAPASFASPPANPDDPFADLLAGLDGRPAPAPSVASRTPAPPPVDPLFMQGAAAAARSAAPPPADDPFADLLGPGSGTPQPGGLKDFSDLGLRAPDAAAGIDHLFAPPPGSARAADPFADSPFSDPPHQPNTAGNADPFAALSGAPSAPPAPRSDHVSVERFGYAPPKAVVPPAPAAAAPGAHQGGGALFEGLGDASPPAPPTAPARFDDLAGEPLHPPAAAQAPAAPAAADDPFAGLLDGMGAPPGPSASPASAPTAGSPALFNAPPIQAPPPSPAMAFAPAHSAAPAGPASTDEATLLAALLRGLASTHHMPQRLTPELMERIGVLLRSASEGTLQLLHARQELKKGVRAEVTMIAAEGNNPLKFSPTAEVALGHLLGPGTRGFMAPEAAMRDAYDDLRAHEFGVMVGMRAALAHVLTRFTPAELEKKISARSALDAVLPGARKARLWDQFVALHGEIAAEAEDDFHSLFGKAFLKAYEEQMARLKSGRG